MIRENNYEIIKFEDGDFCLDVNVSPNEDTVWLSLDEISILFDRDKSVISRHIKNIFIEQELEENSVIAFFATTASDGKIYTVKYYNLDMILAIGYKVKSKRGTLFRRWASFVLKQFLLNGYVVNESRCLAHSDNLVKLSNTIEKINLRIENLEFKYDSITSTAYFKDKVFYNGELFEGYSFIKNLFSKALNRIIIIDPYLDYSVLEMLNEVIIPITIYIYPSSPITNREITLFQTNHSLNVIRTNLYHDRFIVIDDELYNVGSSIKDIGKKISHISKFDSINIEELLNRYSS